MKKILALLLVSVMSLGILSGCGKDGGEKIPALQEQGLRKVL